LKKLFLPYHRDSRGLNVDGRAEINQVLFVSALSLATLLMFATCCNHPLNRRRNASRTRALDADGLQREEWALTLDPMASHGTGLSVFLNVRNWVLHSGGVYRLREAPDIGFWPYRDPSPSTCFELMQNETISYGHPADSPPSTITPGYVLGIELLGCRRLRARAEAIYKHMRDFNLAGKMYSTRHDPPHPPYPYLQLHHGTELCLHFDLVEDIWDELTGVESPSTHRLWSWRCGSAKLLCEPMWNEPYAGCNKLQLVGEILVLLHLRVQAYAKHARYCHTRYLSHETRCSQFLDHMALHAPESQHNILLNWVSLASTRLKLFDYINIVTTLHLPSRCCTSSTLGMSLVSPTGLLEEETFLEKSNTSCVSH